MANLVITSSTNTITITSNVYLAAIGSPCVTLNKHTITKVYINSTSDYLVIETENLKDFTVDLLGFLGGSAFRTVRIDTINGVVPTTLQELHDLFVTMLN